MTDTTHDSADVDERPAVTCPFCTEAVPQATFCMRCGRQIGQLDLTKIFTSSERAAGYAEVDQRTPLARTGDVDSAVLDEPEVEHEEPVGEPDARPTLRVLFGGLFGRSARPTDAADDAADVEGETASSTDDENPSLRTLFASWLHRTPVDPSAENDEQADDADADKPAPFLSRLFWVWAVAAVVVVGIAALFVATSGHEDQQSSTAHVASAPATTLPGWAKKPTWAKSGAVGAVGVTSDGNYVGYAHGRTVTVLHAGSGRIAATLTLHGKAVGGVSAVTVDGKPALAAASKTAVTVWGAGKLQLEAGIPTGGEFQVRAGVPFVTTDTTAAMLTGHGAVPVTFPRPGALIMGGTANEQVLWASARGEVLTAATNGTVTRTAKLAAPKSATEISSWVVATDNTVWVRWKTREQGSVLAAHDVGDGKAISSTGTSSDEPVTASQDGKTLLVQGTAFTAAGKTAAVPKGFVADGFVGNHLYGADQDGTTAYVAGKAVRTGPAPTVVPVAETGSGDLIAVTDGRISTYATADQTTKQ
ncbi:hypothetical protein EDF51_11343 [Curtobacterium sp. PhB25]|uniref:hypothetical protein n=1 Tax=Curtobacterium sp. PhB25 TaxID=2485205 RepID=UPI0010659767|nr:hypothetical protein [Curtobacterium sp. PhB25]TDW64679.1 hypothetical protein EDF51_11343 [Curtobacterium sp. PhB25]